MIYKFVTVCVCVGVVFGSIGERGGWLDRVVAHFKGQFFQDVQTLPPVQFKATIKQAPPGYVDSEKWDYDSVLRLLTLLGENKQSRPVLRELRRVFNSFPDSRRYIMDRQLSYKFFPKLPGVADYYADSDMSHEVPSAGLPGQDMFPDPYLPGNFSDTSVVVVSNPVESRLPSAHISVAMLRDILMARALAGREMPPTTTKKLTWGTSNKTHTTTAPAKGDDATDAKGDDNSSNSSNSTSNGTNATKMGGLKLPYAYMRD